MDTDAGDRLLYMENEHYALVDSLPYIDTQLGQMEIAQQVKALIEEEMAHFEPRDYLASLPAPEASALSSEAVQQEFARIESGEPMQGIDALRYTVERPQGNSAQDSNEWRKAAEVIQRQLEYNRLRLVNLELLDKWGTRAWVAQSLVVRSSERLLSNEATALRSVREEVNKKRKLDQISCGNELRKLTIELEQYQQNNIEVERGLKDKEAAVHRLRRFALERGVAIDDRGAFPGAPLVATQAEGVSLSVDGSEAKAETESHVASDDSKAKSGQEHDAEKEPTADSDHAKAGNGQEHDAGKAPEAAKE